MFVCMCTFTHVPAGTDPWGAGLELTGVGLVGAHRAEQILLLLVVSLAQQLALLQHKLVTLAQLPLTHAAAEATQVVHALQCPHHKLRGGDLLHAATALGCEEPTGGEEEGHRAWAGHWSHSPWHLPLQALS